MTFGEKLQKLRAREGLSQDALAELLNVSRQAVSRWERTRPFRRRRRWCGSATAFTSPPTIY